METEHLIRRPDIEKTTVSVRTLVIVCGALILTGGSLLVAATTSWINAQNQLAAIVKNQEDQKSALAANAAANQQLAGQLITVSQQVATLQKRMDDYRPFKWSTPMQIEYTEQLEARNPKIDAPDPQSIHDKVLPFTP